MIFDNMTFNMDIGTFLIASIGAYIAYTQLSKIQKQISLAVTNQKLDSLKIVLEIETQINSRKLELDKATRTIAETNLEQESKKKTNKMEILSDYFDSTKESYFNALDRLCYCIDKKYIEDKDWRAEYRTLLLNVIETYPDDFNEASPYYNIKKINMKWQTS